MFLQDHLRSYPEFKGHVSFLFGTGLPFGPPDFPRYLATYRSTSYRRVDLGLSYDLLTFNAISNGFGRHLKNLWIGVEVLNLLDIRNTISYSWVNDIQGGQYAVPNYLTSQRINVTLSAKF
jgi:hypothetical protein